MTAIHSPITGEMITQVADAGAGEVAAAYDRADEAFRRWRRFPATERGRVLHRVAEVMRDRSEEVAELETLNTGRPLRNTRGEAQRAALAFDYYAGWADKVVGTTIPVSDAYHTYTLREPRGRVLGIIPWNAPYVFAALKIAPALAFGNASLLKPAAETPLSARKLQEIILEAGVPEGVAQVVLGGRETGEALVADGRADLIAFTGHHQTGKRVATAAAATLTPTSLELGGKSPQIVFADADLEAALHAVMLGVFGQTGQMCIAGSRVFVEREVHEEFTARLCSAVRDLRVGDPREEGVEVGPQTTAQQRDKTLAMIDAGQREGARVLAQAAVPGVLERSGGYFVPPTVFGDVDVGMEIMQEEIFGPVVGVAPFEDEADALAKAHETPFGLAAGVWTSDIGRAHRFARELDVGTVWVNTYRVLSVLVPFGGVGRSGYGREGGEAAIELYTRVKSVWTALEPGLPPGYRL